MDIEGISDVKTNRYSIIANKLIYSSCRGRIQGIGVRSQPAPLT